MKIMIFGVTGNTGKHLAKYFIKKGDEVYGSGRSNIGPKIDRLNYIQLDIKNKSDFARVPLDIDLVINLAGVQPSILKTSENTDLELTLNEYVSVNMSGTYNLLEFVSKTNADAYIYATTHRDYENYWHKRAKLSNNMPVAINYQGDHAMYAISKEVGKMMGDYIIPLSGKRCFNLRFPMIFMVPDDPYYLSNGNRTMMPFMKVIKDAVEGRKLEVWGDPNLPRDYVYIENVIRIIEGCIASTEKNCTFSVGTGEAVTTEKFIRTIAKVFGNDNEIIYRPEKLTYKSAVYDITETVQKIGYTPIYLEEMLTKMKEHILEENKYEQWGWYQ